jgi:hypothetical protein
MIALRVCSEVIAQLWHHFTPDRGFFNVCLGLDIGHIARNEGELRMIRMMSGWPGRAG